ncbi:MAG: RNA repair transcriptional activator RtcR [Lentisphaerota bacterium]
MKKVLINLLGIELDSSADTCRWAKWRPSVAICQHREISFDRYHLIYQKGFKELAETVKKDIQFVSPKTEVILNPIVFKAPWDFEDVYQQLFQYTRSFNFDTDNEEYYIGIKTGTHVARICMFLLAESHHFPAKLIQISKPDKSQFNPIGFCSIIDLDLSKYDSIAMRFRKDKYDDLSFLKSGIKTKSKSFNKLIEMIERVAINSPEPILLMGPTGAGKSQLARRIFELKKLQRKISGKFVELNCATLRGDSAMSSLFGHKKGSFTGALNDREGLIKTADNGILFLDEIGELGIDEQTMLLRAIEEKKYFPLGSDKEITSSFQLICGTNRDLKKNVADGKFRDDLFARINLWTFTMPSLKDRAEDIEPNIDYEIDRFSEKYNQRISFSKEAKDLFLEFAVSNEAIWTSNFRDLNAAITRMGTLSESGRITVDVVKNEIERLKCIWNVGRQKDSDLDGIFSIRKELAELDLFDKLQLEQVVKICRDSKSIADAGRKLFSSSRESKKHTNDSDRLRKYLIRFNLNWTDLQ